MRIVNLIENTEGSNVFLTEHGLSFYIETKKHKILVDTGASNAFIENAKKLQIDLQKVDTVILSHGHYDHSGGILGLSELNKKAKIYMQRLAIDEYYHKSDVEERYIGIDSKIQELSQIEYVNGNKRIDEQLFLFGGVEGRRLWPAGNRVLAVKRDGEFHQDEFLHEQYLVIKEDGKHVLVSGCAHNGILNILDSYREIYGINPDVVISGFHLMKKNGYTQDDLDNIKNIALELKETDIRFYTGHCTGELPYQILREVMEEQVQYVHSGDEVKL